jgi:hypothetical protein
MKKEQAEDNKPEETITRRELLKQVINGIKDKIKEN